MSVHADLRHLNKVWEIKPLKMPGEDEARKILENVAKQVEPIMHKRRWKVTLLSEFCPPNASLLGLNIGGGAEIRLRLRKHNRNWDFFPYESILDTMLHELCHNVYGPHNGDFYRLWDEIREELTELMIKGIGRQLGGSRPQSSLRQNALGAAQKRARVADLMPGGPARVGGDVSIRAALSPAQAAAMAAERRLHDDLWCVTRSREQQNNTGSSSTASRLTENAGPVVTWQCGVCTLTNRPISLVCEVCETPRELENIGSTSTVSRSAENAAPMMTWRCNACTLTNRSTASVCEACETPREQGNAGTSDTASHPTENVVVPVMTWQCNACTLSNRATALVCEACETPREQGDTESSKTASHPTDNVAMPVMTWQCNACTLSNRAAALVCEACETPREQGDTGSSKTASHPTENIAVPVMMWQCNACTLSNQAAALVCEACDTPREEEKGSKLKRPWSCKFCTMKNHVKLDRCKVCGEWRYSTGPPVSGYTPFTTT